MSVYINAREASTAGIPVLTVLITEGLQSLQWGVQEAARTVPQLIDGRQVVGTVCPVMPAQLESISVRAGKLANIWATQGPTMSRDGMLQMVDQVNRLIGELERLCPEVWSLSEIMGLDDEGSMTLHEALNFWDEVSGQLSSEDAAALRASMQQQSFASPRGATRSGVSPFWVIGGIVVAGALGLWLLR